MSKSVSCRTPADHGQDETRIAGNPTSTARTEHISSDMGTVRITLRVLRPDGDVRQDIGLLIARDTVAHSAQVSRVCDPLLHMVSGRGHRFTAPEGASPHYRTPGGCLIFAEILFQQLFSSLSPRPDRPDNSLGGRGGKGAGITPKPSHGFQTLLMIAPH